MFAKGSIGRRLGVALAVVVVLDLVLARTWLADPRVGKRPLPPFGALTSDAQRDALARMEADDPTAGAITRFDRELGWCVRPNAVHPGGEYHIDSIGARGTREYAAEPAPGALRLACFGDSFTFGDEVKDEWTFEATLETLDRRVEALNFGVPAYGTDQALLRMRREGLHGARVAVLGLLLENIGRNVNRYRTLWTPRTETPLVKPRFELVGDELRLLPQPFENPRDLAAAVRDGSILERLAEGEYWRGRPEVVTGEWSAIGRLIGGVLAYRERSPERLWLDSNGEPRQVTLAIVDAFRKEALALGAEQVLVLVLPMKEELADFVYTGRAYWKDVTAELDRRGVPYLDLAPALATEEKRLANDPAHPTLYVSSHLSSVGNRVVARELQRWLAARGLLQPAR